MMSYDFIDENRKNALRFILFNKGLIPFIRNDVVFISFRDKIIFRSNISDLGINDISDILGISIVDSVYVHYFLDIARDNGISMKNNVKKKSLGL